MPTRALVLAIVVLALGSSPSLAQRKWTDIGKTASGNVVSIDLKSVKRQGDLVSAVVRVVFNPPVQAQRGLWRSSRVTATFDCKRKYLAAKENVFYSDEKSTKEIERNVLKIPGYGPSIGGSLGRVALDHLCKPAK